MANKIAIKKVNFKSPESQKESKRIDRKPKASGRADFDPVGQLLIAGSPGVKVLTGGGFGGGVTKRGIDLVKRSKPSNPSGGFEAPSIEDSSSKKRTALAAKAPSKLSGKPIRKSTPKKK
jgi:hypothetical protein